MSSRAPAAFPTDLREAAGNLHLRGWRWWSKVILPGIFPYYVTGAITASGGSWNATHRRGGRELGRHPLTATGSAPISPRRRKPATSIASCSASPSCACFVMRLNRAALAAALLLCRAPSSPRLIGETMLDDADSPACSISAASAGHSRKAAAATCWCSKTSI